MLLLLKLNDFFILLPLTLIFVIHINFTLLLTKFSSVSVLMPLLLLIVILFPCFLTGFSHPRFINSILIVYLIILLLKLMNHIFLFLLTLSLSGLFLSDEVSKIIHESPDLKCDMGPIPSSLLPVITNIINLPLASLIFPGQFNSSFVHYPFLQNLIVIRMTFCLVLVFCLSGTAINWLKPHLSSPFSHVKIKEYRITVYQL